jgi:PKD repeat protein
VFATIGTGGIGLRDVNLSDPEAGYFVTSSGANQNPTHGFGDFDVTPDQLTMRFIRGAGGTFTDAVTLTRDDSPPANQKPVAAFTSSASGLAATFDGSGSSDPDGAVASWAWAFGDNTTGSGATPQHTYQAAGTYPVTLTVTDNGGATEQITKNVTVTAPPSTLVASDAFARTVSNGWGTADVGGAWTLTGPTSRFAVTGGRGTITLATAGLGPWAYLSGVSATNVNAVLDVSTNVVATGSGIVHSLAVRRVGTTDYRAGVRLLADRSVQLSLSRVVGGTETKLGTVTVPGLTYAAGDNLRVRLSVTGASPTTLSAKVWKAGDAEPGTAHLSRTDSTAGLQGAGSIGVQTYVHGNVTTLPVVASFDNLGIG